MSGSFGG
nr:cytochrome b6/f complex subunit IV [Rheum officinale]